MIHSAPTKKSSQNSDKEGALKPWVIASVLGAVLLLFAVVGWHLLGAASASSRPDLPVHPGMYNLQQELQKGMAAKQNENQPPGNPANGKRSAP